MNETITPVATATPSNCTAKCETKPAAPAPAAQPASPAPQAQGNKANRRNRKH